MKDSEGDIFLTFNDSDFVFQKYFKNQCHRLRFQLSLRGMSVSVLLRAFLSILCSGCFFAWFLSSLTFRLIAFFFLRFPNPDEP